MSKLQSTHFSEVLHPAEVGCLESRSQSARPEHPTEEAVKQRSGADESKKASAKSGSVGFYRASRLLAACFLRASNERFDASVCLFTCLFRLSVQPSQFKSVLSSSVGLRPLISPPQPNPLLNVVGHTGPDSLKPRLHQPSHPEPP